jgi:hypothetical protein
MCVCAALARDRAAQQRILCIRSGEKIPEEMLPISAADRFSRRGGTCRLHAIFSKKKQKREQREARKAAKQRHSGPRKAARKEARTLDALRNGGRFVGAQGTKRDAYQRCSTSITVGTASAGNAVRCCRPYAKALRVGGDLERLQNA